MTYLFIAILILSVFNHFRLKKNHKKHLKEIGKLRFENNRLKGQLNYYKSTK